MRPAYQGTTYHHSNVFVFTSLHVEGRAGEAWKPRNKLGLIFCTTSAPTLTPPANKKLWTSHIFTDLPFIFCNVTYVSVSRSWSSKGQNHILWHDSTSTHCSWFIRHVERLQTNQTSLTKLHVQHPYTTHTVCTNRL